MGRPAPGIRVRRSLRALVLFWAVFLAAGCSPSLPTSSPVQTGLPVDRIERGGFQYIPSGPQSGASPGDIVRGFLNASGAPQDDYAVARQYLTPVMSAGWKPQAITRVLQGDPDVQALAEGTSVTTSMVVVHTVDEHGRLSQVDPTPERHSFALELVQGNWRISRAPDGVFLPENDFNNIFKDFRVYFPGSGGSQVPDVRWMPQRASIGAQLVEALISGPPQWMAGAVVNPLAGYEVVGGAVPIVAGEARVSLRRVRGPDTAGSSAPVILSMISTTLAASMSEVEQVRLDLDGRDPVTARVAENRNAADPAVSKDQIAVVDNALALVSAGGIRTAGQFAVAEGGEPRKPALSHDGETAAYLSGQELVRVASDEDPRVLGAPQDRTRPSFDRHGYLWAAAQENGGLVDAHDGAGQPQALPVPALAGQKVLEFRLSREGSRAVAVVSSGPSTRILVFALARDERNRPVAFGEPLELFPEIEADQVAWVSADTIVALRTGPGETSPVLLQVGGLLTRLPSVSQPAGLSAGNGPAEVQVMRQDGELLTRVGNTWTGRTGKALDPSFPG